MFRRSLLLLPEGVEEDGEERKYISYECEGTLRESGY